MAIRGVELPDLRRAPHPAGLAVGCEFELSRDGLRVAPREAAWSASPPGYALCRGAVVDVYVPPDGRPRFQYDGCAPAWRPSEPSAFGSSVLTVARDGRVLEVRPACAAQPPCERVLLDRRAIERAASRHVGAPDLPGLLAPDVVDATWLSSTRLALLLSLGFRGRLADRGPVDLVVVFEGSRLVATMSALDDRLTGVEASRRGNLVLAPPDNVLTRSGRRVGLPPALDDAASLAVSPDERWLAVATRAGVFLLEVAPLLRGSTDTTEIRLPIVARDLDWR